MEIQDVDDLKKRFEEVEDVKEKVNILRDLAAISLDLTIFADALEDYIIVKEDELIAKDLL